MLPAPHKLSGSANFSRVVKKGKRAGRKTIVMHAYTHQPELTPVRTGGPRFGLIVSKAVGNAVVRHRVSRRLRHCLMTFMADVPPHSDIVVRALAASATAESADIEADLRSALASLRKKGAFDVRTPEA
ncbi:ribonuclease P protein component [Corynebacterium ulceribovis]|uniref:ribonuclease P protein component n=1 Tax=Corynebacterium ulceribovis TaxID=487732 RepID=UPI00038022F1|nr:ribonuclease P protein component [Corynebacterium ulceribovis]